MGSLRARGALVLLNLVLLATIVWMVQHAVRRSTPAPVEGPLPVHSPVDYAVDAGARGPIADPSAEIGAALDRPLPPIEEAAPVVEPEDAPPLAGRFRLLLVSEDPEDPARSTAIVASSSGDQRTVTIGDQLGDHEVVHIGVDSSGHERQAVLVVERDGRRHELRTEGARP